MEMDFTLIIENYYTANVHVMEDGSFFFLLERPAFMSEEQGKRIFHKIENAVKARSFMAWKHE